MKIAVCISGRGSNLQAIIDAIEKKYLKNVAIQYVIADRLCTGIEKAQKHQLTTYQFNRKDNSLFSKIDNLLYNQVDYIVLAGFLSIIPTDFCEKWAHKIINLHPSLLPKYGGIGMYGNHVHRAVLHHKEKESGATIHFVTPEVDRGEIILQKSVALSPNETLGSLKIKIRNIEHWLIVEGIKKLADSQ